MTEKTLFFRMNQRIDQNFEDRFARYLEKVKQNPPPDDAYVYLLFDCPGGIHNNSVNIVKMMRESEIRFCGVAKGRVNSMAILVYLSCDFWWYPYQGSSALLHRARSEQGLVTGKKQIKRAEKQVLELIATRLDLPLRKVYELANQNTVLKEETEMGKKFFLNM